MPGDCDEVVSHHSGIGTSEGEDDTLDGEGCWEEPAGPWEGLFEEDDLRARSAREVRGEFEIDCTGR